MSLSTEKDVNIRRGNARGVLNGLNVIWKSDVPDYQKRGFFRAFINQLNEDPAWLLEDRQSAMDDRDGWRQNVSENPCKHARIDGLSMYDGRHYDERHANLLSSNNPVNQLRIMKWSDNTWNGDKNGDKNSVQKRTKLRFLALSSSQQHNHSVSYITTITLFVTLSGDCYPLSRYKNSNLDHKSSLIMIYPTWPHESLTCNPLNHNRYFILRGDVITLKIGYNL